MSRLLIHKIDDGAFMSVEESSKMAVDGRRYVIEDRIVIEVIRHVQRVHSQPNMV